MKAIVFDFDGVLADTYLYAQDIVKKIGINITEEDFKAHHDGNVFEKPRIPFTQKSSEEFDLEYLRGVKKIKPFINIEQIKSLSDKYDLFIISSNNEESINEFLIYNKLNYFKGVYGGNFNKSKIAKFEYLFKSYNLKPTECIFITDTLGDIIEGNKVNVRIVAVNYGFHEIKRLQMGNPFKIVSNINEVLTTINDLK